MPVTLVTPLRKKDSYHVLRANKDGHLPLKAIEKTADIFVGRVIKDGGKSNIKQYIKEVFDITVKKIEILKIKTDEYNAFKVTENLSDRDTIFNPDLWPEGLVINNFIKGVLNIFNTLIALFFYLHLLIVFFFFFCSFSVISFLHLL